MKDWEIYTNNEITDIFNDCVDQLIALKSIDNSFNIDKITLLFNPEEQPETCALLGSASVTWENNCFQIKIKLNSLLFTHNNIDILKNTIFHELCHAVVFNLAHNYGILSNRSYNIIKPGVPVIDYSGHDSHWQKFAEIINSNLKLKIPLIAAIPDFNQKAKQKSI